MELYIAWKIEMPASGLELMSGQAQFTSSSKQRYFLFYVEVYWHFFVTGLESWELSSITVGVLTEGLLSTF